MKTKDIKKTQHFSIYENIITNLWSDLPNNIDVVEPFCGAGDLLTSIPKNKIKNIELYDIDISNNLNLKITKRNTLKSPPDYTNKYVVTNPPYLARNKTSDKSIFDKYNVDDLYKAAILSILSSSGGILVIPLNFLTDKRTYRIREKFFEKFFIKTINLFEYSIFENTDIQTISFSYRLKNNIEKQKTKIYIYNENKEKKELNIQIDSKGIFNDLYDSVFLDEDTLILNRITEDYLKKNKEEKIPIVFNLIDKNKNSFKKKKGNIESFYTNDVYIGKNTSRTKCSFYADKEIVENTDWKQVVEKWNNNIDRFRTETHNISLTNFRDVGRKRLTITECKQLLSKIIKEINNGII